MPRSTQRHSDGCRKSFASCTPADNGRSSQSTQPPEPSGRTDTPAALTRHTTRRLPRGTYAYMGGHTSGVDRTSGHTGAKDPCTSSASPPNERGRRRRLHPDSVRSGRKRTCRPQWLDHASIDRTRHRDTASHTSEHRSPRVAHKPERKRTLPRNRSGPAFPCHSNKRLGMSSHTAGKDQGGISQDMCGAHNTALCRRRLRTTTIWSLHT
mmetsp:Transcript_9039/g.25237  ORF Transcript_9039/g.25237 Transcript_9039/m.25237 type:complete len:210 (+) Transcript_9039:1654-2283(+)